VIALGFAVRVDLTNAGLFLQRASACLWTAAMAEEQKPSATSPVDADADPTQTIERSVPAAAAAGYLAALTDCLAKINSLGITPTILPLDEMAVEEAR